MTAWGRAALAVSGLLWTVSARAEPVSVTVVDRLSQGQQEETIAVYFTGKLAGTVHIDAGHPEDQFTATIERSAHVPYTLCGRLVSLEADGRTTIHPIDNGGLLGDVAGRTLYANTLGNVLFSLQDSDSVGQVSPGPACDAVVAAR